MASNLASAYAEADAQMGGGSGLYGNQNGGTSPTQQTSHLSPDQHDIQLQENIAQLTRSANDMMHVGQQSHHMGAPVNTHHQFQTPTRPTHSPQQMAQSVMSLENHDLYTDLDGSRKRSKVSRACDECRRKKIRCDATSENGPEACSSCKRTGARCQFSRQPMKRGPSKGYIKELADRLNSLENQIQHPHTPPGPYDFATAVDHPIGDPQGSGQFPRKRTHSMSESIQDAFNRSNWGGQDRDTPSHNGQAMRRPSYGDLTLAGNLITGTNEGTIKAYYSTIHTALPILSEDSVSLNRLTNCPAKLRESFFLALECSVRSYSPASLPPADIGLAQLVQKCLEAVELAQHILTDTDNTQQFFNNIVYCQTLVFLVIASDRPAIGAMGSTSELLGRLAGRISELGLNDSHVLMGLRDQDRDVFGDARRLFWVAFILDRFHASGRSKDTVLPLFCGSISRDDLAAMGESGYHLTRAADIVGQITFVTRAGNVFNLDPASPFALASLTSSSPQSLYLGGQLSRYRESLEITDLPLTSLPWLAYHYLRIVVARLSVYTTSKEILGLTKDLLGKIINAPITPLHHIFASLIATSLTELSDRVETQADVHASIKEMDEAMSNGHIVHRTPSGSGWDTAIRNILLQKKAPTPPSNGTGQTSPVTQPNMAGLQHLAAAAVGERESADARPSSSSGNALLAHSAQDTTSTHDLTAAMAAASEAAKAQATAAAAQKEMQSASGNNAANNGGNNQYDASALLKEGFMSALT